LAEIIYHHVIGCKAILPGPAIQTLWALSG
jgi:hypothetical protein